ncbi:AAA family ATPase [Flavobacterium aestivum]|uniref:AAA family ATPase n=1 Tax=Flavobacterium aestivum TaxID=3003257 RepID=UPI002482B58D|nr:AAA family ATPase [Flavobacterium aestivum]
MIIKFQGEHKSLKTFESQNLDDFSVITGKNGCGKSQLIELIGLKANSELSPLLSFDFEPKISKIQLEGIENSDLSALNNSNWKSKIDLYINQFNSLGENTKLLVELMVNDSIWMTSEVNEPFFKSITTIPTSQVEELVTNSLKEIEPKWFTQQRAYSEIAYRLRQHNFFTEIIRKTVLVSIFVARYRNKPISDLVGGDFYLTPVPDYFLDDPKLFGSQLEFVFYNYAKRRDQNQRLFFEKSTYDEENNSISDEEFIKTFIPPWTSINVILSQHNLKFQFKGIDRKDFSSDANISFQLIKTTVGKDIEFQHLSSGEKVIIGLIIKLFTSYYYSEKLEFPELIVLDEPDAHLHPEMSKLLIDVLLGTFVQKLGIKVIVVTHSPSTVALCPDNSIYQLENEPVTTLHKIEKNEALKLLTDFIPTLSIDYKNHKQVFVESPTDIRYYQTIFNKLNQERNYPFRLYFISNSYGKGSCEQVIKIVDDIRESGNTTVFGIIDWDLKNSSNTFVKVHGENKRYNVENYLYDPIYLSILFMNLKAHGIYKELGIEETINQYLIGNESDEFLQKISDWFFSKYYEVHKINEGLISDLVEVEYLNGKKIKMPIWFLQFQGHDYETRLKQVFNALDKFTGEGKLQQEITTIVGKCYPFIPKDSELLIEEIINGG